MKRTLILLLCIALVTSKEWLSSVTRVNKGRPVIANKNAHDSTSSSTFNWNYNAAFMRSSRSPLEGGLLVRCQNRTHPSNFYSVGPSYLVYTPLLNPLNDLDNIKFKDIDDSMIVVRPGEPSESGFGVEDPRTVYNEKDDTHYLLHSAVASSPTVTSQIALATVKSADVENESKWVHHGDILKGAVRWSKSGALLIRPGNTSYLYWGDSDSSNGMFLGMTRDLLHYKTGDKVWLPKRPQGFETALVEGGPHPFLLSDGNYIMIYNSARGGFPSHKPGWSIQYNLGYVILDGQDPTQILYRTEEPIFSPALDWEIADQDGLTPRVVFCEGWTQLPGKDSFLFFYGAADSFVGAARLDISIKS